jgi:hypothetical protein
MPRGRIAKPESGGVFGMPKRFANVDDLGRDLNRIRE